MIKIYGNNKFSNFLILLIFESKNYLKTLYYYKRFNLIFYQFFNHNIFKGIFFKYGYFITYFYVAIKAYLIKGKQ